MRVDEPLNLYSARLILHVRGVPEGTQLAIEADEVRSTGQPKDHDRPDLGNWESDELIVDVGSGFPELEEAVLAGVEEARRVRALHGFAAVTEVVLDCWCVFETFGVGFELSPDAAGLLQEVGIELACSFYPSSADDVPAFAGGSD